MANQDTELTLSTGKLLGIFFGLVAICAVFFSLGYAVGKGSSSASNQVIADSSELSSISSTGGAKPAAGKAAPAEAPAETAAVPAEQTPTETKTEAKSEPPAAESAKSTPAPEVAAGAPGAGFMVQVAAVSKKEDAEALVAALRKKQYPVLVVNNVPNSPLFHVQVGPFAQKKDAEAMRTKLAGDGYNAILK